MTAERKVPLRTCIACRETKPKRELLRIVKNGDEIALDRTGKLPGRGAYVCDSEGCIGRLRKYKLLNKTFSAAVPDEVYAAIEEAYFGG